MTKPESQIWAYHLGIPFHMVQRFGAPFAPQPYHVTLRRMADVQIAFFRQLCRLKRSVTPAFIFRELSAMPWVHRWWNQVIGFMHRLSNMPEDSVHAEILRDNIADAQEHPSYGNWAGGIVKQYSRLGMVSPFSSSGITGLNSPGIQANMEGSALQGLGWSACVPKNSSLKKGKALHILCMVSASQSAETCALL